MTTKPTKPRTLEQIAVDVLRCCACRLPESRIIGNVRADEIARLTDKHITSCPSCGSEPWVNIDCLLCSAMHEIRKADR